MRVFPLFCVLFALCLPVHGAEVVISEFLAGNDSGQTDEDGDFSDWIELHNISPGPVQLDGWFLTDDSGLLDKWRFPDVTLPSGAYLVVYASAKDRRIAGSQLHTNFRLSGNGEYLGLVRPDGSTVEHDYAPAFPDQSDDISYGIVVGVFKLVSEGALCRYEVPADGSDGLSWTGTGYDDASWDSGQSALGYDTGPRYTAYIFNDVSTNMLGVSDSLYMRVPFNYSEDAEVESMTLSMRYDDGFVAYLNGTEIFSTNAPAVRAFDASATGSHPDNVAIQFESFIITNGLSLLQPGAQNVLAIHGMNDPSNVFDVDFLMTPQLDVSGTQPGYLATPTPGAANSTGLLLDGPVLFPERGIYETPFQVTMTSAVAGATIRYTTDFSEPDTSSPAYTGPIDVSGSTVIRAAVFLDGFFPSPVSSHTYLFPDDVINQPAAPPGFPFSWNGAEYAMRTSVTSQYTYDQMTNFLHFLPSVCFTTEQGNLFDGTTGIYVHPNNRGEAWERFTTMEWINPDGTSRFGINCGLRIYGGLGGGGRNYKKKGMRLLFKDIYGAGKLREDVFDGDRGATRSFDHLIFRHGGNDRQDYTRDEFARRTQLDMGQVGSHGRFVHLYLNGIYWGMYNMVERPSGNFAPSYYGGNKDNWDALAHNANEVKDGDNQAWNTMIQIGRNGLSSNTNYQRLQGNNPDGTRNPALPHYLDVPNHIDYMLGNIYHGMGDWPHHNWYAARERGSHSTGFKSFIWDGEGAFRSSDRTGVNNGIAEPYGDLRANAEFNLLFADHVQRHLFNGGALTTQANQDRYAELNDSMEFGVITESARWGHISHASWISRKNGKISFINNRTPTVLNYLRNASPPLYPSTDAPVFSSYGELLTPGFSLNISSAHPVYYTLDGSDPREYASSNPVGTLYTAPLPLTQSVLVKARARSAAGVWSALVEAPFVDDVPFTLAFTEIMYHPEPPSGVNTNYYNESEFEFIELLNTGTAPVALAGLELDRGVNFDFATGSVPELAPGARVLVISRLDSFKVRYPDWPTMNIAGAWTGDLDNAGEEIRIRHKQTGDSISITYRDARGWPERPDGSGHSLVPLVLEDQPTLLDYGLNWGASSLVYGSPGVAEPAALAGPVINEVIFHANGNDRVELYVAQAGDPDDWFLSDDPDDLQKWTVPNGLLQTPGYYIMDSVQGVDLDRAGGTLYLSHLSGSADRVVDALRYNPQETDRALGRFPDGDFFTTPCVPTPAAPNQLFAPDVYLHEVMYHPQGTNREYLVLHNPTAGDLPLESAAGPWRLNGDVDFDFETGRVLPAGGYLAVVGFDPADTVRSNAFLAAYGLSPGEVELIGPYRGSLDNRGGRLALERPQLISGSGKAWVLVDEVIWFDRDPWPLEADGHGFALHRGTVAERGNDPLHWMFADPSPGSGLLAYHPLVINHPAEQVSPWTAQAEGEILVAGDGGGPGLTLYYGTNDAGTVSANWEHALPVGTPGAGPVTTYLSGLSPSTDYWYRYHATNSLGESWATPAEKFRTAIDVSGWPHQMKITFSGYPGPVVLPDFPLLVKLHNGLNGFDYAQFSSPTGADLRFMDATLTTELNYEIEAWNPAGTSYVWVQVPELSAGGCIFAFWGATGVAAPPYTTDGSTWTRDYLAVWHLNEAVSDEATNGQHADATTNLYTAAQLGNEGVPGLIAGGQEFDGIDDGINAGDIDAMDAPAVFTASMWFNRDVDRVSPTTHQVDNALLGQSSVADNDNLEIGSTGDQAEFYLDSSQGLDRGETYPGGVSTGVWHQVVMTYDAAQEPELRVYVDGQEVGSAGNWNGPLDSSGVSDLTIGYARSDDPLAHLDGKMDEVRLSTVARSPQWIHASWLNVVSNESFAGYGAVQMPAFVDVDNDGMHDGWELEHFGSLAVSAGTGDQDNDTVLDLNEFVAGTIPTNDASFLMVEAHDFDAAMGTVIRFPSEPGRLYSVEARPELTAGDWELILLDLPAAPPINVHTVEVGVVENEFYRLRVRQAGP